MSRRTATAVSVAGALALSCGGSDSPMCPDNDCTPPTVTVVRWTLNAYPERLFQGDTCNDLDVKKMRIDLTGIDDPTVVDSKEVDCNQGQATFLDLPAGDYAVVLTPFDNIGMELAKQPVTGMLTAATPDEMTTATINLPFETWKRSYTGTFLFRLSWAGASCETASPAVALQTLTLMVGETTAATVLTDTGQKLDGTDAQPCRPLSEAFAQFAEGIAMGPAKLTVVGTDGGGSVVFDTTFDTFVGAAKNNPTITFDVTPPAMDAGVDAPPDGP